MGDNGYFNLSDFDGDWDAGETRVVAELTESPFDDTTQEPRAFSGSFYSWDTGGEDVAISSTPGSTTASSSGAPRRSRRRSRHATGRGPMPSPSPFRPRLPRGAAWWRFAR
jgi:hypothetical protein